MVKDFESDKDDCLSLESSSVSHKYEMFDAKEDETEAINSWRQKKELEIEEMERLNLETRERLQDAAIQAIHDFYNVYNSKKQQQLEQTKNEAETFSKECQQFFNQDNSIWDRVLQLINIDDSDNVGERDRSTFKKILLRLQGRGNLPYIAGISKR